jgi:hypothetical protein
MTVFAPLGWRVLLRRGWLLVVGALLGLGVGSALAGVSVSAESAFHVTGAGSTRTPYQASRLARTYAQLLPQEPRLLRRIGAVGGISRDRAGTRLSMVAQESTGIVFARYSAPDANAAYAGIDALTRGVRQLRVASGRRLSQTLAPLSDASVTNGVSRTRALLLGVVGGGLLGLVAALVLERRNPRVDDLAALAQLVPLPVSRVRASGLAGVVDPLARRSAGPLELVPVGERRGGALRARLRAVLPAPAEDARPTARALIVRPGAPAYAVEQAWTASRALGLPVLAVLLLERDLLPRRVRHGLRAA